MKLTKAQRRVIDRLPKTLYPNGIHVSYLRSNSQSLRRMEEQGMVQISNKKNGYSHWFVSRTIYTRYM